MQFKKSGSTGLAVTIVGVGMLVFSFLLAYQTFNVYFNLAQSSFGSSSNGFVGNLSSLLDSVIVVMFLGIMGWVGSIFLLRGVDFMKVDRGVGIVTFKVDKGVGVVSGVEVTTKNAAKENELETPNELSPSAIEQKS
jgi:hypothetical protein